MSRFCRSLITVLLIVFGAYTMSGCDGGRRKVTPREQVKISEIDVRNGRVGGGGLDARVMEGDLTELRIYAPESVGAVIRLRGYGIKARVLPQGFVARLRFRATHLGRFEVDMTQPHLRIGYLTVSRQ